MGAYERAGSNIRYVDATRSDDSGAGTSWATAKRTIQAANALASAGDELWVADGTYTNNGGGTATVLVMKDGVGYYGGFQGNETVRADRNPDTYTTTLDGEDTAWHVVVGADSSIIDGFTITGGNANGGGPDSDGGGIYCDSVSPTIANCTIANNSAADSSGGIGCIYASPTIVNCRMENTSTDSGGGICVSWGSPTIANCTITGNTSSGGVGGIYCVNSNATIVNCEIAGNSATNKAGGVFCYDCSPTITNCTIANNSALSSDGGGILCSTSASPIMTNCILWGNSSGTSGNEIYADTGTSLTLNYCDYGNDAGDVGGPGTVTPANCINADPLFVDAAGGDLRLSPGSPCIDAADGSASSFSEQDILRNDRWDDTGTADTGVPAANGKHPDMGVYEFQGTTPAGLVWYVDASVAASGSGATWGEAFKTIQEAVGASGAASVGDEVWVAEGTYTNNGGGTATVLVMESGVGIYGGFQGNETVFTDRDPGTFATTLDGENVAYHVVVGASNATLDGFTVTRGNANGAWPNNYGGGLYNSAVGSMTVSDCIFLGNFAIAYGGGMGNYDNSNPDYAYAPDSETHNILYVTVGT